MAQDSLVPWTRTLELLWRPELRFYEERFHILRGLADAGYLHAFRNLVQEDRVGAILGDRSAELEFSHTSLTFHVAEQEPDDTMLLKVLDEVFGKLSPRVMFSTCLAQFVLPLGSVDYDEARQRSMGATLGALSPAMGATDYAVLADGTDPKSGYKYQVEYGIIDEDEVTKRLTRSAGRVARDHMMASQITERYSGSTDGPAMFADVRWVRWPLEDDVVPATLLDSWKRSVDASAGIVREIYGFAWPEHGQRDEVG